MGATHWRCDLGHHQASGTSPLMGAMVPASQVGGRPQPQSRLPLAPRSLCSAPRLDPALPGAAALCGPRRPSLGGASCCSPTLPLLPRLALLRSAAGLSCSVPLSVVLAVVVPQLPSRV